MKKFKNLFEQSPAADYKVKKDEDAEVKDIKPRSSDEEKFKNMHKVEKKEHPVVPSEVHTGDRPKGKKSDAGQDHTGYEKAGEPVLKTYAQFAKMGGHGGDSYKGVGKSGGEKAPVMQGSSKIKEEVELDEAKVTKKMIDDLEDRNEHGMVALKLAQAYGTAAEVKKVQDINKRHNQRGHIEYKDQKERDVIIRKYYKMAEEADLDEAFKAGKIQFKDGKYKVIDAKTAEILNNAMNELNTTNRKRMETEAMKDTESFEAMLKFAKAAV